MPQLQQSHSTLLLATMFARTHTHTHTQTLLAVFSALFTCSLLSHWKAVGAGLSGCPPCPRHILYSVQFLQREEVCWESEAQCGGGEK